ncbi:AFL175Cp [Eremothecium gossypii ATCC 10895]|uniref:Protein ROT1 n=1 Tax=Eremothecium gossypii (strain ATCC 10895 / CBS 109.51 / FGSC 9923 / NRRL Y-1056) TaxID=284811 RepID=ROT1_EREGS|nr:AFL175Cp [Eremothecium gossypii ATCC 10895]Q755J8.2 RecName: Full=Protein ROT1; Flags: Precursor [Eremothecium gossypii ATCC 10895]AAS53199.2 AFL175Cp [Eremothecium gossypii ATCC 10895]AEY97509.1 FAFL175Cp [Eremothecium gossypii FDAG1]
MVYVSWSAAALLCASFFSTVVLAQSAKDLYGTWSAKSNQVFTGPGFYNPADELLIEPSLPGISYSFTEDGFFEMATYRVSGNPRNLACPSAVMTFQHGKYEILANGTLILRPFEVDGRQLVSEPCVDKGVSTYLRYSQVETFQRFAVELDEYHGKHALHLFQFDGSPVQPLYLAYRPPLMLPTITLNPTDHAGATATAGPGHRKRSLGELVRAGLQDKHKTTAVRNPSLFNAAFYWWCSAGVIAAGTVLFFMV